MVAVDTDIFVLAYAFHHDERQPINTQFLAEMRQRVGGGEEYAITIYSVMELLGKLSFNLSAQRLGQWQSWFQDYYGLTVLYPQTAELTATTFFVEEFINRPLRRMQQQRLPFLDGLILGLAEDVGELTTFVTWNARHYRNKTSLAVLTPAEYLAQQSITQ